MAYLGSKTAQQLSVILEWNVLPGPLLTYVSIHVAETVCMCLVAARRYRGKNGDVLYGVVRALLGTTGLVLSPVTLQPLLICHLTFRDIALYAPAVIKAMTEAKRAAGKNYTTVGTKLFCSLIL